MDKNYIAIDIGASSGRVVVFSTLGNKKDLKIIHRFNDYLVKEGSLLYWDIDKIFAEILFGIKKSFKEYTNIESIGIDTFGVDVALLDLNNKLIQRPLSYRNNLGLKLGDNIKESLKKDNLYDLTGIQYMPFNTLYQLIYIKDVLNINFTKAVLLPDYLSFLLTGKLRTEVTNFSTTNLMNLKTKKMIKEVSKYGIHEEMFPEFIDPGLIYGQLDEKIKKYLDIKYDKEVNVVAVCTHDTASAIVSINKKRSQVYLSSGTWGILGTLSKNPITSKKALKFNYSNELGYDNEIRFLKNTSGLWIQNEAIRNYKKSNPNISDEAIRESVLHVEPFKSFIDVDDVRFTAPINMIEEIQNYCLDTNQPVPIEIGEIIMCIYQSLAFKYKKNIIELEQITKRTFKEIYIVGGGSSIDILNQMISSVTKKIVVTGETEATIMGNLLIQLKTAGQIKDLKDGIKILKTSKEKVYEPNQVSDYEDACIKYNKIIKEKN